MNALGWPDLLALTGHFMLLSLLAIGGAITTASDMHRYVVAEHGWISDAQFTSSIAIAQAAPGPNAVRRRDRLERGRRHRHARHARRHHAALDAARARHLALGARGGARA